MSDSYYPDKRKVSEREADLDAKKPIMQLLADVHDESLDSRQPDAQRLGRVIARFASLLVVLSRESDETADKNLRIAEINLKLSETNLRLQKWMIGFTILAILLGFIAAFPILKEAFGSRNVPQQINAPAQPNQAAPAKTP